MKDEVEGITNVDECGDISEQSKTDDPAILSKVEISPVTRSFGIKMKEGIINFFEGLEEIFERVVVKRWNKIQIKLFWMLTLLCIGASIGVWGSCKFIVEPKINEAITLKSFMIQVQKYDKVEKKWIQVTEIYDITPRVR